MMLLLTVSIACGLGALLRFLLSRLNGLAPFPVGTLAANLLACFFMAVVTKQVADSFWSSVLTTGFLGGLGTYSSVQNEVLQLRQRKGCLLCYFLLTYLGGLALIFLGFLW